MIYFMQPTSGGPVKTGHAADIDSRRAQLESHYGQPLAILATMPGDRDEEQALHARFAHLRFGRTEQFRPAADLMASIGRPLLVDANPEAIEAMEGKSVSGIPVRLTDEAIKWARIASGYTGESMSEYVSRIAVERGKADAGSLHAEATKGTKTKGGDA